MHCSMENFDLQTYNHQLVGKTAHMSDFPSDIIQYICSFIFDGWSHTSLQTLSLVSKDWNSAVNQFFSRTKRLDFRYVNPKHITTQTLEKLLSKCKNTNAIAFYEITLTNDILQLLVSKPSIQQLTMISCRVDKKTDKRLFKRFKEIFAIDCKGL